MWKKSQKSGIRWHLTVLLISQVFSFIIPAKSTHQILFCCYNQISPWGIIKGLFYSISSVVSLLWRQVTVDSFFLRGDLRKCVCVTCSSQWYLKWVYMISDLLLLFVYQPACMYSCRLTTQHVEWICLCVAKIVMFSTSISVNYILGVNKTFCRWQKRSVPDHLFMDGAFFTNVLVSVTRKKKKHH